MENTIRQVFLDTETTGKEVKDGHRIVEIACVEYVNREPTANNYHTYINPERDIDPGAFDVHGLDREFLSDYPVFADIAKGFFDYIQGAVVIIHNAEFDVGMINGEIGLLNKQRGSSEQQVPLFEEVCEVKDSLALARNTYSGRCDLDSLCKRLEIDNTDRTLHGALIDATLLAKVYMAMTSTQGKLTLDLAGQKTLTVSNKKLSGEHLKIVYATKEELVAHDKYIQELQKSNSKHE